MYSFIASPLLYYSAIGCVIIHEPIHNGSWYSPSNGIPSHTVKRFLSLNWVQRWVVDESNNHPSLDIIIYNNNNIELIPPLNGPKYPRKRGINGKAVAPSHHPEIRTSSLGYARHCFVPNTTYRIVNI